VATPQRIGVYGICRSGDGRVLLVRASRHSNVPGRWFLPGGGLEHGEAPLDGLRRELAEETGLVLGEATLRGVLSDTWDRPDGTCVHTVRIIYSIERWDGDLVAEADGSSDAVNWVSAADFDSLPVMPYVAEAVARFA
jgi:8-oxo-dGTP pyrophosphatase MutT (NUDIX family)